MQSAGKLTKKKKKKERNPVVVMLLIHGIGNKVLANDKLQVFYFSLYIQLYRIKFEHKNLTLLFNT